jgi:AraC-like DNA-binding protein/ligand-binding sensor protein
MNTSAPITKRVADAGHNDWQHDHPTNPRSKQTVLERLAHSQIYQDYERAFGEATGLPLTLSPVDDWHMAHAGRRHENAFCALLAKQNKTCSACLQTQQELTSTAQNEARTVTCFAGLSETAVPLRAGDHLIGFLRTGEVLPHAPTKREFSLVLRKLVKFGMKVDEEKLRDAYFHSRVSSPRQYESVVKLLQIFAQHLCLVASQLVLQRENSEPVNITKAREFINANHTEDLTLAAVAQSAHMSVFYFCKQFKKATGMSFTEYLGRVRIEKAKEQLLKPHARVSEVAYEVGFQSLTHFNRVFKKLNGESPTTYRTHLPLAQAA